MRSVWERARRLACFILCRLRARPGSILLLLCRAVRFGGVPFFLTSVEGGGLTRMRCVEGSKEGGGQGGYFFPASEARGLFSACDSGVLSIF